MRGLTIAFAILTTFGLVTAALAAPKHNGLRLAQTSTTTNCMLTCNSQQALCQTDCVVPGTPPTGAATTTSNANASTSCLLNCTSQQLACQIGCAQTSPSQ